MSRIYIEYDLIKQIATGSFSSIYKAKRKSDGLLVAIKIFEVQSQQEINLIETEAKVLKHLMGGHPSIPNIYDFFNEGHVYFIIMDFLEGYVTLLEWTNMYSKMIFNDHSKSEETQRIVKIRERKIASIFTQIVSSINYLHKKCVVHRDLKLENIMIDPKTLSIKLIDFGFATITETMVWSTICGSFEYLAPEILADVLKISGQGQLNGEIETTYNTQSEIWPLGIVLYGMVFCRLPFFHSNRVKLINQVLYSKLNFQPEFAISNPILKNLLNSMLEKDPADRITLIKLYNHPFLTNKCRRIITGKCNKSLSSRSNVNMILNNDSNLKLFEIAHNRNSDDLPKVSVSTHFLPITFRMSYHSKVQNIGMSSNLAKTSQKRLLIH